MNVKEKEAPFLSGPLSNAPLSEVTVCEALSLFIQVTVVPL